MQVHPTAGNDRVATLMRTLGDPTRKTLFERLAREGEATVVSLTGSAGVSQPAVSQHLKALRAAGLVSERREGRNTFYRVEPEGMAPLIDWLDHYGAFWRDKLTDLKTLLQEIDPK